jgi:glutathione synthase/RimK-type ligase-like ATP-grasp enzyme
MTPISATKRLITFFYLLRKTKYSGITTGKSERILPIKIWGIKFFADEEFIHYMALINALSENKIKFKIRLTNKLGQFKNKIIFFWYTKARDPFEFTNYAKTLHFMASQLEEQECKVYPRPHEVLFWENKGHMTKKFIELGISTPKTMLITREAEIDKIDLPYPYLIKEEHSASSTGVHKISKREDLTDFFKRKKYFDNSRFLIVQELLEMRRDIRVILVGDKVVHHYWRINPSEEWKPTASSFGGRIEFGNFPEQWREFIIGEFKKLDLTTGGFDIAWRNDDLTTQPLILEVSPHFQPNPIVDLNTLKYSYGEYKKKLLFRNSYEHNYVDIVFKIVNQEVKYLLSKGY